MTIRISIQLQKYRSVLSALVAAGTSTAPRLDLEAAGVSARSAGHILARLAEVDCVAREGKIEQRWVWRALPAGLEIEDGELLERLTNNAERQGDHQRVKARQRRESWGDKPLPPEVAWFTRPLIRTAGWAA